MEMEKENLNVLRGYAVYDKVAKRFMPPFFCENLGVALRQFNMTFKRNPHIIQADYQLFYIGSFDVIAGIMVDVDRGENVLVFDGGDVE